jgi:asparagine synthetase B (glutamine-hydrolysing)
LNIIATGEGSDDLFGSFPVMVNWKYGDKELIKFINTRMKDIDLMTQKVAKNLSIKIILPFHNEGLKKFALNLPLNLRTQKGEDGEVTTKFILREAFKYNLPKEVIVRPQTMAFTGASTLDYLMNKYSKEAILEDYKKKYGLRFTTSFECYLFEILNKTGKYHPINIKDKAACLYCRSKLRSNNSVHCSICGTLQYKKKILPF